MTKEAGCIRPEIGFEIRYVSTVMSVKHQIYAKGIIFWTYQFVHLLRFNTVFFSRRNSLLGMRKPLRLSSSEQSASIDGVTEDCTSFYRIALQTEIHYEAIIKVS